MNTTAYLGIYGIAAGMVFIFTSGIYAMFVESLGIIFLSLGVVFLFSGIAFILWNTISSINVIFSHFAKRS